MKAQRYLGPRRRLKRHSPIPLYVQIRDDVRAQIERGELGPGDRLPSEPELTAKYDVGRPTVRQALDLLRREGISITIRGSGTYIARDTRRISLLGFDGLTHSLRARGIDLHDKVLASETVDAPPVVALDVDVDVAWWVVTRLRSLVEPSGDLPFCVESDAFNLWRCPDAEPMFEESRSAAVVLEEGNGLAIATCDAATRAVAADKATASLLDVDVATPLLAMERVNRALDGEPVHVVTFLLRTDRVPIVEHLVNTTISD